MKDSFRAEILIFLFAGVFFLQKLLTPLCYRPVNNEKPGVKRFVWRDRFALVFIFLLCALLQRGTLDHRAINPTASAITKNRVANEIANSGIFNVL